MSRVEENDLGAELDASGHEIEDVISTPSVPCRETGPVSVFSTYSNKNNKSLSSLNCLSGRSPVCSSS